MRPDFHGVSRPVGSWAASSGQCDDQSAESVPDSGSGPSFAQKEISGLNRYDSSHAERSLGCFFMLRQRWIFLLSRDRLQNLSMCAGSEMKSVCRLHKAV